MSQLHIPIPSYTRQDSVLVTHTLKKGRLLQDGTHNVSCTIYVQSIHGPKCLLPLIQQVDVDFQVYMQVIVIIACCYTAKWQLAVSVLVMSSNQTIDGTG